MLRKGLLIMLVLLVGFMIAGCGPAEKTPVAEGKQEQVAVGGDKQNQKAISIRYAHFVPQHMFYHTFIEDFAKQVEKRSEGRIEVEIYPGGSLLTPRNMYDGVSQGMAEIGYGMPSAEPGRFPLIGLLELPLGFPNSMVATQVTRDLIEDFEHDFLKDFKVLTILLNASGDLLSKPKVESLGDLRGMEVRTVGAMAETLSALGATPISLDASQLAEALETGIVKGLMTSKSAVKELNFVEYIDYIVKYPLAAGMHLAVMDLQVWDKLPVDLQQIIDEEALEMNNRLVKYIDEYEQESQEWLVEQGVQLVNLTPEERTSWDTALQPVIDKRVTALEKEGFPAKEFIDKAYELIEKYKKDYPYTL